MKRKLRVILTLSLLVIFACSCSNGNVTQDTQTEVAENALIGSWAIDATDLIDTSDPMISALTKVLEKYFKDAPTVEFENGGKAKLGGTEAEYILEDNQLTLICEGSLNFVCDVKIDGNSMTLSYQDHFTVKFTKVG